MSGRTRFGKKVYFAAAACLLAWAAAAQSQAPGDGARVRITRSSSQDAAVAPGEHFTGTARIDTAFQAGGDGHRAGGARVSFEPGARTAWHMHPLGQILFVTAGKGRVQRWGDTVNEIRPGDVVWIPPGQKHWHGAAPDSAMTHFAIAEQLNGKTVEWMEKVSDAQYNEPPRGQVAGSETQKAQGGAERIRRD